MRQSVGRFVLLLAATPLSAQKAPATGLAGTWHLDASRIGPGAPSLSATLNCSSGARMPRVALTGESVPSGSEGWSVAAGGLAERRGRPMVQEARPPGVMTIALRANDLTVDDDGDGPVIWPADGVKRAEAQVDGGTLEVTSQWKGAKLVTERRNPLCKISVRREYQVVSDGKQLELKIAIHTIFQSQERKFYYDRDTTGVIGGGK